MSFGTVDVCRWHPLSNERISDEDKCLQISLLSKGRQIIIFNSRNSQQKNSNSKMLPVTTGSTISEVGPVVKGPFELDLLNHQVNLEIFLICI